VEFAQNKQLLNRYRFVEYEMLRILAGWLPATSQMELKLAIGRLLWEDAQHVQHLYQRLREIQTPAFRDPGDAALLRMMAEAIHAPSERDLLAGLCRVIKPALAAAYRWHMGQTFANPDAPTLYAFKHILLDEDEHVSWAAQALAEHPAGAWEQYIAALLAAAGGITGREARGPTPAVLACRRARCPLRAGGPRRGQAAAGRQPRRRAPARVRELQPGDAGGRDRRADPIPFAGHALGVCVQQRAALLGRDPPLQARDRLAGAPRDRLHHRAAEHADLRLAQPVRPGDAVLPADDGQREARLSIPPPAPRGLPRRGRPAVGRVHQLRHGRRAPARGLWPQVAAPADGAARDHHASRPVRRRDRGALGGRVSLGNTAAASGSTLIIKALGFFALRAKNPSTKEANYLGAAGAVLLNARPAAQSL